MSEDGRRKLREYGIAPPGACRPPSSGPRPIGLTLSAQVPALRVHHDQGDQPVRLDPLQVALVLPGLRRTLRLLQGDLMIAPRPQTSGIGPSRDGRRKRPTARRRHAVFHPLRVASVDRLTEDSVAITFDVPEELREEFRFNAGQHLSVRAAGLGDDVRRNYSICAPATGGPLRIGVKRIPDGVFSGYAAEQLRAGDVLDVMTPSGTFSTPLDRRQRQAVRGRGGRVRDHPGAVDPGHRAGSGTAEHRGVDLRQPPHLDHHVPGGAGGPEEPVPRPVSARPRPWPGDDRGRDALRPARCRASRAHPGHHHSGRRRRRMVPLRAVGDDRFRPRRAAGPGRRHRPCAPRTVPCRCTGHPSPTGRRPGNPGDGIRRSPSSWTAGR